MNLWFIRLDAHVPGTDLEFLVEAPTKDIEVYKGMVL